MSEPTITPDDLELPDWGAIHEPTQDRTTQEVETGEPHPDH